MKKKIWIWNHYATNMFFDKAGRHYYFAENLIKDGYKPTIFCASTNHFSENHIDTKGQKYLVDVVSNIPFVFISVPKYRGSKIKRLVNMISFYKALFNVAKEYAKIDGKPDVIVASSVHPLTLVAGIKVAKKLKVPCICEIRDLWPESLVAYNILKKKSLIAKILYQGEKWIYSQADRLIFTMEGGNDYIIDHNWDIENGGIINLQKVFYLNNGLDLEKFKYNLKECQIYDKDLMDASTFKVIYTGSIRKVNNVMAIIKIAEAITRLKESDIKFIIYGDGEEREELERYCLQNDVGNVLFKGRVNKENIPFVLSKSDLNIIHFKKSSIVKYGSSLNKMVEYFASGKPILSDCEFGYDMIKKYNAGLVIDSDDPTLLARAIITIKNMDKRDYLKLCSNAEKAAEEYDFKNLTQKLRDIIEM